MYLKYTIYTYLYCILHAITPERVSMANKLIRILVYLLFSLLLSKYSLILAGQVLLPLFLTPLLFLSCHYFVIVRTGIGKSNVHLYTKKLSTDSHTKIYFQSRFIKTIQMGKKRFKKSNNLLKYVIYTFFPPVSTCASQTRLTLIVLIF